ncbi:MAG: hypothetical protein J6D15_02075 [Clostridia bacterium]|nr:hypothetical protein [Clostridia bacterium]
MGFDFLKKKIKTVNVEVDENGIGRIEKKNKWVVVVILIAVLVLAFWSSGEKENPPKNDEVPTSLSVVDTEYIINAETKLGDILSKIKGAGKVKVMISFDAGEEKVLAKNQSSQLETEHSEDKTQSKSQQEENVLLYDSNQGEEPFVVKEKLPVPTGVLVVAEGAASESIRLELYEAVKALYGISGHRVKVSAASGK